MTAGVGIGATTDDVGGDALSRERELRALRAALAVDPRSARPRAAVATGGGDSGTAFALAAAGAGGSAVVVGDGAAAAGVVAVVDGVAVVTAAGAAASADGACVTAGCVSARSVATRIGVLGVAGGTPADDGTSGTMAPPFTATSRDGSARYAT